MKSLGLLAASFTAAQAWQVLLYSNAGCTGSSYFVQNAPDCSEPLNEPADFDAKSVLMIDVPKGWRVNVFTDNNLKCDKLAAQNTWAYFISQGGSQCEGLNSSKMGKWRLLKIESE